ncbi:MAG: YcaO-related McrA-glycine thioamidation protein [archaeon]|nr:YcaO-related McrA-glycine thioamidation protein [archaeon]
MISPGETLERIIPLLGKAGIDSLDDITNMDDIGIPVFSVCRKNTAKGVFGNYNGKGVTVEQAKASALMEAIERYSAELRNTDKLVIGTLEEIRTSEQPMVEPKDLILPQRIVNAVEGASIAWTRAFDLLSGNNVWVPACAVYYPYYPTVDLQLFRFHTNGIASGNTIEEAILHSIFEVVERDAWSIAESFNRANSDIILDDENSIPGTLLKHFKNNGIDVHLKDLTSDVGIPTVGASADDVKTRDPEMLTIGIGTHLNPEIAAIRALTELAQSRATHKHGLKVNTNLRRITRDMGYNRIKEANKIWYHKSQKETHITDMKDESTAYVLDDIEIVLGKLVNSGFKRVIIADLTRHELNIPTVRAIIPGMEVSSMDFEREGLRVRGEWPNDH